MDNAQLSTDLGIFWALDSLHLTRTREKEEIVRIMQAIWGPSLEVGSITSSAFRW